MMNSMLLRMIGSIIASRMTGKDQPLAPPRLVNWGMEKVFFEWCGWGAVSLPWGWPYAIVPRLRRRLDD